MEFTTVLIAVLIVGLAAAMTADVILDMETIWNSQFERGSGRLDAVEKEDAPERPVIADISWVSLVEDEQPIEEVDVIQLAKSRQKPKTVQAGTKVRELLDNLGKSVQAVVDYSSMNIRQLKALASEFKIKGYGKMKKAELIFALESMS